MIPESIIDAIEDSCQRSFGGIFPGGFDFRKLAREFVEPRRIEEQLALCARASGRDLRGMRLLEVGSGYGALVAIARTRHGIEAFGVEPGEQFGGAFTISQELFTFYRVPPEIIRRGVGEKIPYDDASFDVVYSANVLEHVKNPFLVLRESLRVLRPGGRLVFVFPNYGSWWEGHYGIPMIPHCPKWALKLCVSILGRDSSFIDTLEFVTYRSVRRWVSRLGDSCRLLDMGQDLWVQRLRSLDFSEWAMLGRLKRILKLVAALRLTELVIFIGRWLHWETPFVLVLEKQPLPN